MRLLILTTMLALLPSFLGACGGDDADPDGGGDDGGASDAGSCGPCARPCCTYDQATGMVVPPFCPPPAYECGGPPIGDGGPGDAPGTDAPTGSCPDGLCGLDEDATSCCADCGVCTEAAFVRMETGVAGGTTGTGLTPGGMADTHAQFTGASFTEIVFPFTVTEDPGPTTSYFWAQQFFFEGTTQGGYLGVQTNGIIGGSTVGKMMIFSIWDTIAAEPGDTAATCQPFGGEGIGYSCRLPFDWRVNVTYRLTLREAADDRWSVTLTDPTTGAERVLGTITALPAWGRIRPPTAGFAEYYGEVASCATLPRAVAILHQPIANGAAPFEMDAGTYGTCMAQATSTCVGSICR